MAAAIEVTYRHFEPDGPSRDKIDELVRQLDKFADTIIAGRVVVDGAQKHGSKTVVEIHVEVEVKGKRLYSKRTAEYPDPAGQRAFTRAATEAFHNVQRQIREHGDRLSVHEHNVLEHQRERGRILSLDRNEETGFVEMPDGVSLFFSAAVLKDTEFNALVEGDMVLVTVAQSESPYGPQASSVELESPEVRAR